VTRYALTMDNVSKFYKLYNSPKERLKEALNPFGKKYHSKYYALKNINLKIEKGEVLGIVGKNGSGKSTLLKLISGVLGGYTGNISVNGKIAALLELGSGFNPEFTGIQNIYFYGTILGLSKKYINDKINEIVEFADIGEFINQPLKVYSSGMKSRLGFAVAINVNPDILILDEVLAVGDAFFQRKCFAKMEEFFRSGKTIIFVSHDAQSIVHLCSRAVLLHENKIVLSDKPKVVIDKYNKLLFEKEGKKNILDEGNRDNASELTSVKNYERYIQSLGAKSTIEKYSDLEITNICILDDENRQVNLLKCGATYTLGYDVKTKSSKNNVRCAFNIKDTKGIAIGGGRILDIDCLHDREILSVKKRFYCNFKPGTYFVTAAIFSINKGESSLLFREIDALVFKIDSWPHEGYWGLTYIGVE